MGICTFLVGGLSRVGQNAAAGSSTKTGSFRLLFEHSLPFRAGIESQGPTYRRIRVFYPELRVKLKADSKIYLYRCRNRSYILRLPLHRHLRRDLANRTLALPSRDLPPGNPRQR